MWLPRSTGTGSSSSAGDIRERGLGLEPADLDRLKAKTTKVFHLAAIYDLAVPKELAQAVNVEGTGNVLELCESMKKLERLAYVSTAYVAGKRTGIVYEHELSLGQDFKNHYESTKFQAEVWVRQRMGRVPTTILRPAIVVGDSQTGETEKFDGPYYILRTISAMNRRGMSAAQFGRSDASFNVVPVDYVVKAMVAAAGEESTLGETLHLVDPEPLSSLELFKILSRLYAGRELRGQVPAGLVANALRLRKVQRAVRWGALRVGRVPEPPGHLRHAAGGRPARPARARASSLRGLRPDDRGLLQSPRGRPEVHAAVRGPLGPCARWSWSARSP